MHRSVTSLHSRAWVLWRGLQTERMTLWSSGGQFEMKVRLTDIVSPLGIRCGCTSPPSESQVLASDAKMKRGLLRPDLHGIAG